MSRTAAQDVLTGTVVVHADRGGSHAGIRLVAEGLIKLQLSARSVGLFEAFYSSIRPVSLLYHEQAVASAGKLDLGATEFPFSFPVQPCGSAVRGYGRADSRGHESPPLHITGPA